MNEIESYPLCWPSGVSRSKERKQSRFGQDNTVHNVHGRLKDEIGRLGGKNLIISTDMRTRIDGEPMANAREPEDTGASVYFDLNGKTVCLACDKWLRLWENLYSIAKTIDAMRAIDRWGVSDLLDRMFTGFIAITDGSEKQWFDVLGVDKNASEEEVKKAYRERMRNAHPDAGGSDVIASEIITAYKRFNSTRGTLPS